LPVEPAGSADSAVSVAQRDALDRAFRRLSPEHRAVVVLHHHIGMPLAAVAEVVGVPLGTVKSRLHHGTRAMRAALQADEAVDVAEVRPA
jgi:RNA polymerase sigma-70 factor (ECF subfamily)